ASASIGNQRESPAHTGPALSLENRTGLHFQNFTTARVALGHLDSPFDLAQLPCVLGSSLLCSHDRRNGALLLSLRLCPRLRRLDVDRLQGFRQLVIAALRVAQRGA